MSFIHESRRKLSLALQEAAKTQSSTRGQSKKSTSSSEGIAIGDPDDNNMDVIVCETSEHSQVVAGLDQSIDNTIFDHIAETFDPDMFLSNIDEADVFNDTAESDPNAPLDRHDHVDHQIPQFVDVTFCEDFPSTPLEPADETEEALQATRILQKMVELNDEKVWKSLNFEQAENDSKANHVTRNAPETETGNICLSKFSNFVAPAPCGLKDNTDQEQILQNDTWLLPHPDLTLGLPTTRPSATDPNEPASGNYQPGKNLHILGDSNVNVSSAEVGKKKKSKKILSPSSLFRKREQNRQRSKAYRERKKLELENLKLQVMVATREATEVKKQMIKMKKREPLRN